MRVRVKICGVTTAEAALAAAEAGADAVGLVLAASPRRLDLGQAAAIAAVLPPFVARVAVVREPRVRDLEEIVAILRPDLVQCEPAAGLRRLLDGRVALLPAFHDGPGVEAEVARYLGTLAAPSAVLLDGPAGPGRGVGGDWARAASIARRTRLVLAGGLTAENVGEAIRRILPYAVDVSSGVEAAPGVKDARRIGEFLAAVRHAEAEGPAAEAQP